MIRQRWERVSQQCYARIRQLSPAAIILGSVLNMLEAVSFGPLIFPKHTKAFDGLDAQAISLFIMSTVLSQATLSLGGTTLSPSLSSMLAELLPFFRSIASGIHEKLGDDHPGVLPTTMAAFAMSSIAMGASFLLLAVLRCGSLVGYFPQTVMTGVMGAVGVSLVIFALEVTFPADSHLTITTLFSVQHMPLLAASALPALLMYAIRHVGFAVKRLKRFTSHALYVPICCFTVTAMFWIPIAISGNIQASTLAASGWLFKSDNARSAHQSVPSWNYWALFDFAKVEWGMFSNAAGDMALLVLIGVLTLPIFVQATVVDLKSPKHSMNHEFGGHGFANLFIAAALSLPATMISSNTRLFDSAKGKRHDALVVTLVGVVFFFTSSYVLPYVPTILASMLIMYVGLELIHDALVRSSGTMVWHEWVTVAGTTLSCTFRGFAQGLGIGLGIVMLLYVLRDSVSSRPLLIRPCELAHDKIVQTHNQSLSPDKNIELSVLESSTSTKAKFPEQLLPPIIKLKNRVEFADKPAITRFIEDVLVTSGTTPSYIVFDLQGVIALETCVAEFIAQQARRLNRRRPQVLTVFTGVTSQSEVHERLAKAGLELAPDNSLQGLRNIDDGDDGDDGDEGPVKSAVFHSVELFLRSVTESSHSMTEFEGMIKKHLPENQISIEKHLLNGEVPFGERMLRCGLTVKKIRPGQALACERYAIERTFLVLEGEVITREAHDAKPRASPQRTVREALVDILGWAWHTIRREPRRPPLSVHHSRIKPLASFKLYDEDLYNYPCAYAGAEPCKILFASSSDREGVAVLKSIIKEKEKQEEGGKENIDRSGSIEAV